MKSVVISTLFNTIICILQPLHCVLVQFIWFSCVFLVPNQLQNINIRVLKVQAICETAPTNEFISWFTFFLGTVNTAVFLQTSLKNLLSPLSAADGAGGRLCYSSHQRSAELFSFRVAEPQCGSKTVHISHQRLSVALHTRQTLETDGLPLRGRSISFY